MSPSLIEYSALSTFTSLIFSLLVKFFEINSKFFFDSLSFTLSCGRFGPEILGTTVDRSNDKVSVNFISPLAHKPCSLEYVSTNFMFSSSRPDSLKYLIDSSSTGKKPQVAPYSGAMFAIVARSASGKFFKPSP